MAKPTITEADVRWAHRFMCLTTPFDAMPPLLRVAVETAAAVLAPKYRHSNAPHPAVDFKRRAAGDLDD